jgi:hypothetical protein
VIGVDSHRTFAEVVFWEGGKLRPAARVSMIRAGLEGFGRSLGKEDEVVIEATGNAMAVVRVLSPHVGRVIVANLLQVKAIAHAHVKTEIDAGALPSCSVGWAGSGWHDKSSPMTRTLPSNGACASSIGLATIWRFSTERSNRRPSMIGQ